MSTTDPGTPDDRPSKRKRGSDGVNEAALGTSHAQPPAFTALRSESVHYPSPPATSINPSPLSHEPNSSAYHNLISTPNTLSADNSRAASVTPKTAPLADVSRVLTYSGDLESHYASASAIRSELPASTALKATKQSLGDTTADERLVSDSQAYHETQGTHSMEGRPYSGWQTENVTDAPGKTSAEDRDWFAHQYKSPTEYAGISDHVKYSETYHKDADLQFALKLQREFDAASSPGAGQSWTNEWQDLQAEEYESPSASKREPDVSTHVRSSSAEPVPEVDLLALKVPVDGRSVPLADLQCQHCAKHLLSEPIDFTNAINSWLSDTTFDGCVLTCRGCGIFTCVGCFGAQGCNPMQSRGDTNQPLLDKIKGKLRSSTRKQSGQPTATIPDWSCPNAHLGAVRLLLIHFDKEHTVKEAQAAAQKHAEGLRDVPPSGVGYALDDDEDDILGVYDDYDEHFGNDMAYLDDFEDELLINQSASGKHVPNTKSVLWKKPTSKASVNPAKQLVELPGAKAYKSYADALMSPDGLARGTLASIDDKLRKQSESIDAQLEGSLAGKSPAEVALQVEVAIPGKKPKSSSKKHKHSISDSAKLGKLNKSSYDTVDHKLPKKPCSTGMEEHAIKSATGHYYMPPASYSSPLMPSFMSPMHLTWQHGKDGAASQYPQATKPTKVSSSSTQPGKDPRRSLTPSHHHHAKKSPPVAGNAFPASQMAQSPPGLPSSAFSSLSDTGHVHAEPYVHGQVASFKESYASNPSSTTPNTYVPNHAFATNNAHDPTKEKAYLHYGQGLYPGLHPAQGSHTALGPYVFPWGYNPYSAAQDVMNLSEKSAEAAYHHGSSLIGAPTVSHYAMPAYGVPRSGHQSVPIHGFPPSIPLQHPANSGHHPAPFRSPPILPPLSASIHSNPSFNPPAPDLSPRKFESVPYPPPPPMPLPSLASVLAAPPHYSHHIHHAGNKVKSGGTPKGTGYGGKNDGYGGYGDFAEPYVNGHSKKREPEDDETKQGGEEAAKKRDDFAGQCLELLSRLLDVVPFAPQGRKDSEALVSLLLSSRCLDTMAETLRHDSLNDATKRKKLYAPVFKVVAALMKRPETRDLVVGERPAQQKSQLLHPDRDGTTVVEDINDRVPSLKASMAGLIKQCKIVIRTASAKDTRNDLKPLVDICNIALPLWDMLCETVAASEDQELSSASAGPSISDHQTWLGYHRDHAFEDVPDDIMFANHAYAAEAKKSKDTQKGRMKRLIEEGAGLSTSLPPGILVRYAENRPDVMKALIIGPAGTPYHGGMFEFDIWATDRYPSVPPKCQFKTTGGGRAHFNPNLYECGKVCLSLLGTWSGERWRPGESTILQILVSLQAMVLCEEPWFNEPGREHGYSAQSELSQRYNQEIQSLTVKWAMDDVLVKHVEAHDEERKTVWGDVVKCYVKGNKGEMHTTVEAWMKNNARLKADKLGEKLLQRLQDIV